MNNKYDPTDVELCLSQGIRNYLAYNKMTQKNFALLSGVSSSHICAIVNMTIAYRLRQGTIDKVEAAMVLRRQGSRIKPYKPKGFWARSWQHVIKSMRF